MILVVLGTNDKPFTRLLKAVEDAVKSGDIQDEVMVQRVLPVMKATV